MEFEEADGAGQVEAFRAGAARVEEQRAAPIVGVGLMAVPEDDYVRHVFFNEPGLRRAHLLNGCKLMTNEDGSFIDDCQTLNGKAHRIGIIVTTHGNDGRYSFEFPDQLFVADVARMNDVADIRKEIEYLFFEFAVCV